MGSIRKLVSGKWQVAIRRKDQPVIYKTFQEKGLATKYGKDVEPKIDPSLENQKGKKEEKLGSPITITHPKLR